MKHVAAIDCGSNTTRLLIVDEKNNAVAREIRYTRLGQEVDKTKRLHVDALQRLDEALCDFAELVQQHNVDGVAVFATSAVRDATNADEFVAMVQRHLSIEPQILSGIEEAELTFAGAVSALKHLGETSDAHFAMVDIGGGSTELAWQLDKSVQSVSLDIGAVRLTERCLFSNPPTVEEIATAKNVVENALTEVGDEARTSMRRNRVQLVGVAGTVTTLCALELGLDSYDREAVHHSRISASRVAYWTEVLLTETVEERVARGIPEGRAHVIGAGALILKEVVQLLGFDSVLASEQDNLDGQVTRMLGA